MSFDGFLIARKSVFLFCVIALGLSMQPLDLLGSENIAVFMLFGIAFFALAARVLHEPSLEVSGIEHSIAQILIIIGALPILMSRFVVTFHELLLISGVGIALIGIAMPIFHFRTWRNTSVPIAVIFILIPLLMIAETALSYPMRRLSAMIVGWILNMTGESVLVRGTELIGEEIKVSVTSACDGLTLFMHLIWIAWLYKLLNPQTGQGPLSALLLLPATLIANILRILALYWASDIWGVDILTSVFHEIAGWVAVVVAVAVYFVLDALGQSQTDLEKSIYNNNLSEEKSI